MTTGMVTNPAPDAVAFVGDWDPARIQLLHRLVENIHIRPIQLDLALSLPESRKTQALGLIACGDSAPDQNQLETIRLLTESGVPVIAFGSKTGAWALAERCLVRLAGAVALLESSAPQFDNELIEAIGRVRMQDFARREQTQLLIEEMSALGIVGGASSILGVYRSLSRVSALSAMPLLILGESGSGKELFARAVHSLDPHRRSGPLVVFNSASIQSELAESTLFGHRRGSFTGATEDRKGVFRAAHSGVLFLDEVDELSLAMQSRLLRVLETGMVRAVGEDREVRADARIIAATNRDLTAMVQEGTFRLDLYHRLSVVPIGVPPLRERREDIPVIVDHLIRKHRDIGACRCDGAHLEAIEVLMAYDFPGNIRQLENVIRRGLVHKNSAGLLRVEDLPAEIVESARGPYTPPARRDPESALSVNFAEVYDRFSGRLDLCVSYCERRFLEIALERAGGNQSRAALDMGITPRSVYNKLRKYKTSA